MTVGRSPSPFPTGARSGGMVSELVVGGLLATLVFGFLRFQDRIVSALTRARGGDERVVIEDP